MAEIWSHGSKFFEFVPNLRFCENADDGGCE